MVLLEQEASLTDESLEDLVVAILASADAFRFAVARLAGIRRKCEAGIKLQVISRRLMRQWRWPARRPMRCWPETDMLYEDARQHIQSGDLIAFRGRGPVSWLIRHVTGAVIPMWRLLVVPGSSLLLEAREGIGVTMRAASAVLPFDWIQIGLSWSHQAEDFAFSHLGKPYSYADALRPVLGSSSRLMAKSVANMLRNCSGGWTCH